MTFGNRPISVWAVLPAGLGAFALGASALLSPRHDDVQAAASHFSARTTAISPPSSPARPLADRQGLPQAFLRTASIEAIWTGLPEGNRGNASEALLRTAFDLEALGRPETALGLLMHANAPTSPAIWRLKLRLATTPRWRAQAEQLFSDALDDPQSISMDDLIAIATLAGRLDQLVYAVVSGKLTRLSPLQGARVARLLFARRDFAHLEALDRAAPGWDTQDPWLSFGVARARGDWKRAIERAALLPKLQAQQAVRDVLVQSGDKDGLRLFYLQATEDHPANALHNANDLASLGMRGDAISLLERFIEAKNFDPDVAARLIFLLGPRPMRDDVLWLQQQALNPDSPQQFFWTSAYASHETPERAAIFLSHHPRSKETSYALLLLATASDAGNTAGCEQAIRILLDGRRLSGAQSAQLYETARSSVTNAWAQRLLEWGLQEGLAKPDDQLALAWVYWDAKQYSAVVKTLAQYLTAKPNDANAVRLMADGYAKIGRNSEAVFWNERLLKLASPNSPGQAEAFERLGRFKEALRVVEFLQTAHTDDKDLRSKRARLLLALGRPDDAKRALR